MASLNPGDRIELLAMPNDPEPIPVGTKGTVKQVVTLGDHEQIWVDWDIPRSLMLVMPPDRVRVLFD